MAFVVAVVVFFVVFLFYISFKRLTRTSFKTTCGGYASDRTQRFHIRTAKQVVDATLAEIATSFPGFSPTRPMDGRVGDCARRR